MKPPSILIIEDDAAMLRGLKDNFEAEGFQVAVKKCGFAGLEAALNSPPDLLVLDVMLPGTSGYEICRAVRGRSLQFPIILLTARGQEGDIVRGLELGADDYVTKPFGIRELMARAKAFLRRHGTGFSRFEFANHVLDLSSRKLFRGSVEVVLTSKEYKLLEFFVHRMGRALTRDQILDGVWGTEFLVTDRSVDRCVTTLRSKIEVDPHRPKLIKTVRDIGYRFEGTEARA